MPLPSFPAFAPLSLDHLPDLAPLLAQTPDGVSEFTFADLYLFRNRYRYRVSRLDDGAPVISGLQPGLTPRPFFLTPCAAPPPDVLDALFADHEFWKNVPASVLAAITGGAGAIGAAGVADPAGGTGIVEAGGVVFTEDRDNFDYLYLRTDLADLPGKKYHKKRNLVAQFVKTYACEALPLTAALAPEAVDLLARWREGRDADGDGDDEAAREAIALMDPLGLTGTLYRVDGRPAAWCLGEAVARGRMFAVHFEKADDAYKGVYQYVNQAFAAALPGTFTLINREQDLGDEGLRQAKMTYRPTDFVRKYVGRRAADSRRAAADGVGGGRGADGAADGAGGGRGAADGVVAGAGGGA